MGPHCSDEAAPDSTNIEVGVLRYGLVLNRESLSVLTISKPGLGLQWWSTVPGAATRESISPAATRWKQSVGIVIGPDTLSPDSY